MSDQSMPVAVSVEEVREFGCPYCGYRSGHAPVSGRGTAIVVCGECKRGFAMLSEGLTQSTIGFGEYYPELIEHPRRGTPSHGRADKRPEGGGEYFSSRGIGLDTTPGCFVCGGSTDLYHNIAAYVIGKDAGDRIVAMFAQGARVDFRQHEPDYVQVKVGACDKHFPNLELLHKLTCDHDGTITDTMIQWAVNKT